MCCLGAKGVCACCLSGQETVGVAGVWVGSKEVCGWCLSSLYVCGQCLGPEGVCGWYPIKFQWSEPVALDIEYSMSRQHYIP